jgi:hypothetical protein
LAHGENGSAGAGDAGGWPAGADLGPDRAGDADRADRAGNADCAGRSPLAVAMFSATRFSAAMMTEGSGASSTGIVAPRRAPASAASELPPGLAPSSGTDGALFSDRQRSSHSSVVPPQARTNADSTGRSGSAGPTSAALIKSYG